MCITEVLDLKEESLQIEMKDIFVFKQSGINAEGKVLGEYKTTGNHPTFLEEMHIKGIELPSRIFHS